VKADWDCLLRARRGDELAWRVLLGQHQKRLTALVLFVTGSAAAAEDIVQETFLRAIGAKIKDYRGTVSGFLGTIAYRLALKESKRAKLSVKLDEKAEIDSGATPLDAILEDERDRLVAETITSLDERHRNVLILRFYGGYSYEEVAQLLQISVGTVKSRLFYAVKSCREILRRKGVTG
jgi:RNA polymerase sigma-70 factor (ECF subfamily)